MCLLKLAGVLAWCGRLCWEYDSCARIIFANNITIIMINITRIVIMYEGGYYNTHTTDTGYRTLLTKSIHTEIIKFSYRVYIKGFSSSLLSLMECMSTMSTGGRSSTAP